MFDPETAQIGGMAAISVHMTVMSQIQKRIPERYRGVFDFLNYPLAGVEMLLINPPFPYWSYSEWRDYIAGAIALAALASVTANKVKEAPDRKATPSGE